MSTEQPSSIERTGSKVYRYFVVILTLLVALYLIIQGAKLLTQPRWYKLLSHRRDCLCCNRHFLCDEKALGFWLSIVTFIATIIWAIAEVQGLSFWQYIPRLVVPTILFVLSMWASKTCQHSMLQNQSCQSCWLCRFLCLCSSSDCCVLPT